MRIIIVISFLFSVIPILPLAAQQCDSLEYSLIDHIVASNNIKLLSKDASSASLLCAFLKSDTRSKYDYFLDEILPKGHDEIKNGIDSISFNSFIENNLEHEWTAACIDKLDLFYKLNNLRWWIPGKLKYKVHNPPETYYSISKPLFTKDNQYAIVSIETYHGFSNGTGFIEIYKRKEGGGWTNLTGRICYTF